MQPKASRPIMPEGYGITKDAPAGDGWPAVQEKISASRNYWVSTAHADGRPHAMPVWGVVVDELLMFSTDPDSAKGRNMRRRPDVIVHLESGDDVVIIEGAVRIVRDVGVLTRFVDAYDAKYAVRPDPDPDGFTLALDPKVVLTWEEKDFPNTATRWTFG
jgi:general stress protein 26